MPIIVLAPLFVTVFGLGIWSKVSITCIAISFVMFWNVYVAVKSLSTNSVDMMRVVGAGRFAQARFAVLPAIAPAIFAGLRLATAIAMVGSLVGEFVVSVSGIGHYMNDQSQLFNTAGTMAAVIVAVCIVLFFRLVVVAAERRVTRWQRAGRSRHR